MFGSRDISVSSDGWARIVGASELAVIEKPHDVQNRIPVARDCWQRGQFMELDVLRSTGVERLQRLCSIASINLSNRYAASCGPGPASGWY